MSTKIGPQCLRVKYGVPVLVGTQRHSCEMKELKIFKLRVQIMWRSRYGSMVLMAVNLLAEAKRRCLKQWNIN